MNRMEGQQMTRQWPAKAEGYKLLAPVGQGAYGLVWKAKCIDPGSTKKDAIVAIKIIDLEHF